MSASASNSLPKNMGGNKNASKNGSVSGNLNTNTKSNVTFSSNANYTNENMKGLEGMANVQDGEEFLLPESNTMGSGELPEENVGGVSLYEELEQEERTLEGGKRKNTKSKSKSKKSKSRKTQRR